MEGARTYILNGLAQTDLDMNFFKLLNLDISNLPFPPIGGNFPPTIVPRPHFWIDGWDRDTQAWHIDQPGYDDLRLPTGALNLARQRVTFLGDPVNPLDAVNLETLNGAISRIPLTNPLASCVAATTELIIPDGLTRPIDGYTPLAGDRILVKDQDTARAWQNGIWIAATGPWTRAPDANTPAELNKASVIVTGGDTQAGTGWYQTTPNPNVNTDPINWVLYFIGGGGASGLTAGPGLAITGNVISALGTPGRIAVSGTIDIDSGYQGQTSITQLGTISVGVWQGAVVAGAFGGTGVANVGRLITLAADFTTTINSRSAPGPSLTFDLLGATVLQLPTSGLVAVYPTQTGHDGEFLMTDGANVSWQTPFSIATYLNVKNAPYFAKGDGVTDDSAAIQQAINDAAGNGVYVPHGTYYCATDIVAGGACSLIGDGPTQSVLKGNPNTGTLGVLQLLFNSFIRSIGIDGNVAAGVQQVAIKHGISVLASTSVQITDVKVSNTAGHGIMVVNATDVSIESSEMFNCGGYGILVQQSPRTEIVRNYIHQTAFSPVWMVGSPYSGLTGNTLRRGSPTLPGLYMLDCDNTLVSGNIISQCAFGIRIASSPGRGLNSYGLNVVGNSVLRNYMGGMKVDMSDGFTVTGNSVIDNGQGGVDNNTYTVESGVITDPASVGAGYQAGDILTLVGGTASVPAKLLVVKVYPGGALFQDFRSDLAVWPITMGTYSQFPSGNMTATGGHGTGAQFIYSSSMMSAGGNGYSIGQVLRSVTGTFGHPVRVIVTGVDSNGAVKTYEVLDGGGFNGAGLPVALTFQSENPTFGGTGFTLSPGFGRRYSSVFNGFTTYGIATLGPMITGIIGNNAITGIHYGGVAVLIQDDVSPRNGRASYLSVTGNTLKNNDNNFMGQTSTSPPDANYNFSSVFDNNIIYP